MTTATLHMPAKRSRIACPLPPTTPCSIQDQGAVALSPTPSKALGSVLSITGPLDGREGCV